MGGSMLWIRLRLWRFILNHESVLFVQTSFHRWFDLVWLGLSCLVILNLATFLVLVLIACLFLYLIAGWLLQSGANAAQYTSPLFPFPILSPSSHTCTSTKHIPAFPSLPFSPFCITLPSLYALDCLIDGFETPFTNP